MRREGYAGREDKKWELNNAKTVIKASSTLYSQLHHLQTPTTRSTLTCVVMHGSRTGYSRCLKCKKRKKNKEEELV